MEFNTKNFISITEANQNFSKVVRNVEQNGDVLILKNNKPMYVVSKFNECENKTTENEIVMAVANFILSEHEKAFLELAK